MAGDTELVAVDRVGKLTEQGLAAAIGAARDRGIVTDEPRVLSSRGNLLVHLAPAPVVARVATLTAWTRRDPFAWLAREVAVAGYAARNGAPVVPPTDLADPGPLWNRGFALSLWTYLPPSSRRPAAADTGDALARLHLVLADYPGELSTLSPVHEQVDDGLAALERARVIDPERLAALRAAHEEILAGLAVFDDAACVLHGDGHPGNLLHGGDGWRWVDLEETCRGPREWDLAVLSGAGGVDGVAALRAYAAVTGTRTPEPGELVPFHRARHLEVAVWALGMAHQYPARYRELAKELVDRILAEATRSN